MNENKFKSQRAHTRVKFEPLNISCSLVCLTPQSPATQAVNTTLTPVEYEPDRRLTPTVILPKVRVMDKDGVFSQGVANEHLTLDEMVWYINDEDICYVWEEGSDFEIVKDATDMRGAVRIMKNLEANQKTVLRFYGEFLDWRTGIVYRVESDDMPLTCTDKGENAVKCHVDKSVVEYDPLFDDLLLYDYKVARGIQVNGSRDSFKSAKCYEQTINAVLTIGMTQQTTLPKDVTMRVVRAGTTTALVPNSETAPELKSVSYPNVTFDMRMIDSADYEIQFLQGGKVIATSAVGLHTNTTMPSSAQPISGADISASQEEYFNSALISLADRVVDYPELYYFIRWFTQAQYKDDKGGWKYAEAKEWQRGVNMEASVKDLGIGMTQNDSFFDIWFELDAHKACELVADEAGGVLTDEAGNYIID